MRIPHYSKIHNRFKINGCHYNQRELKLVAYDFIKEGETFEEVIGVFLLDWLDGNESIEVQTSGSTGSPRRLLVSKQAMVNSAVRTAEYFGLQVGQRALHCLPVDYIAGKMMLVRAMVLGLDVHMIPPKMDLDWLDRDYDFCAMIPLQAKNALSKLDQIRTLLIGGAPISNSLRIALSVCGSSVFETYGMTETLTHIAVSKVTLPQKPFEVLPEVSIDADEEGCLIISAPHLSEESIHTQDLVQILDSSHFTLIGRVNNVVNSGGKKLFPEQLEKELGDLGYPFFFAGQTDTDLGQKLVLIIETKKDVRELVREELEKRLGEENQRYLKEIYTLKTFKYTPTGKIDRPSTLAILG